MSNKIRKIWKQFWSLVLYNPIIQWIIVSFLAGIIWFIFFASKHRYKNMDEILRPLRNKPIIFVFFHGRELMLAPVIRMHGIRSYCVASRHQDGRMMARLLRLFGLRAVYGSTSSGGVEVLRAGARVINEEKTAMCLAVDGPSGPSMDVKNGALYFARMTGAPIVPVCFSCSKPIYLDRWDKLMIPKLFGTISCYLGEPIYIDSKLRGEEFEKKRQEIEEIMVKQLREMDAEFNLPEIPRGINATEYKKQKHQK